MQDDASLLHRPTAQVRVSMQKLRSLGVDRVRVTANWSLLTREADAERQPADFGARPSRLQAGALARAQRGRARSRT